MVYTGNSIYTVVDELELDMGMELELLGIWSKDILNSLVTGKPVEKVDKKTLIENIKERYNYIGDMKEFIKVAKRDIGIVLNKKELAI